jgi:group I intron endonuclease
MVVYLVTNLINNKKYIGYTTKTLKERMQGHFHKSKYKNDPHYFYLFSLALKKYSKEVFQWEELCTCKDLKDCQEKEIFYIQKYNTVSPNGYNLTHGGNGGIQSDETKKKISDSLKKYYSENTCAFKNLSSEKRSEMAKKAWETKLKNGFKMPKGIPKSELAKQKMSNSKNEKNKITWFNIKTNETVELSLTKMAKYCNLSPGTFSHLKQGRLKQTKGGWTYIKG